MPASSLPPPGQWTVADLHARFGAMPIMRFRQDPPPGEGTVEDVISIRNTERRLYELSDGVLVEKVMGALESYLALELAFVLGPFIKQGDLGFLLGAGGMMRFAPAMVRIPDLAFISWARLPDDRMASDAAPFLSPDLVVEVLSRSNTADEMARKLVEYFEAGVRLVWYFNPSSKTVEVFESPSRSIVLGEEHVLDGGDVLPGFQLPLRGLFDPPSRRIP